MFSAWRRLEFSRLVVVARVVTEKLGPDLMVSSESDSCSSRKRTLLLWQNVCKNMAYLVRGLGISIRTYLLVNHRLASVCFDEWLWAGIGFN